MLQVGFNNPSIRFRATRNKFGVSAAGAFHNVTRAPSAPVKSPASKTCAQDLCPTAGHFTQSGLSTSGRSSVVPHAGHQVNAVTTETETKKWWKAEADLWEEVHDEASFDAAVNSGDKLVFVDFFATWCHGCQKVYPELCKLARDPDITKNYKFVKVCIEELRAVSKRENIKALPMVQIYRPGTGALVGIDVPASKVKNLRHSLQVISGNPGMIFKTDPNGFVMALPSSQKQQEQQIEQTQKDEAEKLSANRGGLYEYLMSMVGDKRADSSSSAATSTSVKSPASSSTSSTSSAAQSAPVSKPQVLPGVDTHRLELEKQIFLNRHKNEYGYGGKIDELYHREVGCRMKEGEHYLDYTGASVYCQSQLDEVFQELRSSMFGNPHSDNPSSSLTSEKVEEVREIILRYFNADPTEYLVVFTRSATGALKMVGETFPWSKNGMFRYLRENHNSVLGIREYALQAGASFQATDEKFVEDWLLNDGDESSANGSPLGNTAARPAYSLFAFPAEDNFAGVKYPLRWVEGIKAKSTPQHKWRVLIDAAAYVPTQPLDLSQVHPDFVSLSFYKMFGYPTGLGALIVRASAVEELHKVFWGGGTVALATSQDNFHVLKCKPSDKLEDGTVNFLDVIALRHGFSMLEKLGGIERVQSHVISLTEWLYAKMSALRHRNGRRVFSIFGKHSLPEHREVQGSIINFEVLRPDGSPFSYKTVEREAAEAGFHVRTGAECNPGACYNYLGVKEAEVEALAGVKEGCEDDVEFITVERPASQPAWGMPGGRSTISSNDQLSRLVGTPITLGHPAEVAAKWVQVPLGSVRVSLGYMSTFEDCYALVEFLKAKYVDRVEEEVAASS